MYIYVYTHTHLCICIHIYMCRYKHIWRCIHTHMYIWIRINTYEDIHTYTCIYYIHIYTTWTHKANLQNRDGIRQSLPRSSRGRDTHIPLPHPLQPPSRPPSPSHFTAQRRFEHCRLYRKQCLNSCYPKKKRIHTLAPYFKNGEFNGEILLQGKKRGWNQKKRGKSTQQRWNGEVWEERKKR